jgi:hypothetical protein
MMRMDTDIGLVELVDEPVTLDEPLDFNVHLKKYPFAKEFAPSSCPSMHGLWLNGEAIAVFSGSGGPITVHASYQTLL